MLFVVRLTLLLIVSELLDVRRFKQVCTEFTHVVVLPGYRVLVDDCWVLNSELALTVLLPRILLESSLLTLLIRVHLRVAVVMVLALMHRILLIHIRLLILQLD